MARRRPHRPNPYDRRPLYLVHLTFALFAVARPNDCLVPVSVSSPASGQRRLPLQSSRPVSMNERPQWVGFCRTPFEVDGPVLAVTQTTNDYRNVQDLYISGAAPGSVQNS